MSFLSSMSEEERKKRVIAEMKEAVGAKLVQRREAPIIGLVLFSIALWGSKFYTAISNASGGGGSVYFPLLGYNVHFHHFHYGIIALGLAMVFSFFEGPWVERIKHGMFGAGLGFIIDEYWMLLIFDDSAAIYFGANSQVIAITIGIFMTALYAVISLLLYFMTRKEQKIWEELYEAVKAGKINLDNF